MTFHVKNVICTFVNTAPSLKKRIQHFRYTRNVVSMDKLRFTKVLPRSIYII